jgi:hypothetical protein
MGLKGGSANLGSKVYAGLVFGLSREAVDVASVSELAGLCPPFLLPNIAAAAGG